jgi:retinol-binding protein 3
MKGIIQSLLSLVGLTHNGPPAAPAPSSLSLPSDLPSSTQFFAWLDAFNTLDEDTIFNYYESNFPDGACSPNFINSRCSFPIKGHPLVLFTPDHTLAQHTGGYNVVIVESTSESTLTLVLEEKVWQRYVRASMEVAMIKPHYPVTNFTLQGIITPLELIPQDDPRAAALKKALQPLTKDLRRCIVDGVKGVLEQKHIDKSIGHEVATKLEEHMARGDYDEFEDSQSFARRLGRDSQESVGPYNNSFILTGFFEPPRPWNESQKQIAHQVAYVRRMNYGFQPIVYDTDSVVGRTIASLHISSVNFVPSDEAKNDVGAILSSVADADALVLDLRGTILVGAFEQYTGFILAYFVDGGPHKLVEFLDRSGEVQHNLSTVAEDKLPSGTKRFGGQKPLFVLVDDTTRFQALDLAYHLQALGRATAIIERGSGVIKYEEMPIIIPEWICEEEFGEKWWMIGVPRFRRVSAITGTSLDGVEVSSDIVAGEGEWEEVGDAMEVARRLAVRVLEPAQEEL